MPLRLFQKHQKKGLQFLRPTGGPQARPYFEYNDFVVQPGPWGRHYLKPNTSGDVIAEIRL